MRRGRLGWIGACGAAALIALLTVPPGGSTAVDHQPLPGFTLVDIDGVPLRSADWRGRLTVVNFWATWCAPCQVEIPELIDLQRDHPDRLQVVGLAVDDTLDAVRAFAATTGINYPVAMAASGTGDAFGGLPGLPTSFVIDPEGHIVARHVGLVSMDVYRDALDRFLPAGD